MNQRGFIVFAALNGAIAVIGGAFAAHGLDAEADAPRRLWLHTAAEYQLIHALAILAVGALQGPRLAQWTFSAGILIFSGSLYLLVITGIRMLGIITPLGGLAFIVGWLALAWFSWKRSDA